GYRIEGRRAGGYTLAAQPDRLGPAELAPHLSGGWRRVHWLEEVDSTQRVARELARAGAPEGTTVIAERQTAGRGRLGRQWHSPAGLNLYCSIVLRPPLAPSAVPRLALVAGGAVARRARGTLWSLPCEGILERALRMGIVLRAHRLGGPCRLRRGGDCRAGAGTR